MNQVTIKEIINNDVRDFSIYNCERSIPSGVDGLKTSQRKVIFGMMKKFPTQETKVSIVSAGVMEISAYHHGSLDGVIVNMAQNFPGANNLPYLDAIGQFGSRISPDAAASRYIFTKLTKNFRQLFKTDDDPILEYLDDDGQSIEPKFYLPILPAILINGAEGMGTGFACSIAAYNPEELKTYIQKKLSGKKITGRLNPWYRGFNGTIERSGDQVICKGVLDIVNTTTIKIKELPIGTYTIKYREVLNALEDKNVIKSYVDNSTEEATEFVVTVPRETTKKSLDDLLKTFKLITRTTENLTVWKENGTIKRFDTVEDLIDWFVKYRLTRYEDRRLNLIRTQEEQKSWFEEQMRFIQLYLKRSKVWSGMTEQAVVDELVASGLNRTDDLLSIRVRRLTGDAIEELKKKIEQSTLEITRLNSMTATDLYLDDLSQLKL